jgi:hypothetical protein
MNCGLSCDRNVVVKHIYITVQRVLQWRKSFSQSCVFQIEVTNNNADFRTPNELLQATFECLTFNLTEIITTPNEGWGVVKLMRCT